MWISTNSNLLMQVSESKTASIYCWFSKLNPQNIVDFIFIQVYMVLVDSKLLSLMSDILKITLVFKNFI